MKKVQIVIVGGGPAGLAAAVAAWEAGCRDLLILEREEALGGILKQCIHNGFGLHTFGEELTGPEYAARYIEKVSAYGIPYLCDTMVVDISPERVVTAVSHSEGVQQFEAGAVILAMGCRERPRGALGIPGWRCSGIYTAGTAQKLVNRKGLMPGRRVVILGSGDIGLIMARRMTFLGAKVLGVVELMPYSSGLKRNIVQCLNDYDIPLLLSHTVVDISGKDRLTGVTIAKVDDALRPIPGTEQTLECDTLLLSVGLIPENELASMAGVALSPATSGAVVDEQLETSVPGIFACGNVLHVHDLVDFVSEEAAKAGLAALRFTEGALRVPEHSVAVESGFGAGGVVPQRIAQTLAEPVQLMFRPRGVYQNAAVVLELDGQEVARRKFRILTPGEMVRMAFLPAWAEQHPGAQTLTVRVALPQEGGEQA